MSDTETGSIFPPQDVFTREPNGLRLWTPVYDSIVVEPLPDGRRLVRLTVENRIVYERRLSAAEAAHLSALLA